MPSYARPRLALLHISLALLATVALGCDCDNEPGIPIGSCPDGSFSCGQYCDDLASMDASSSACGQACDAMTPCSAGFYCGTGGTCTADCVSSGDAHCPDGICTSEGVCVDPSTVADAGGDGGGSPEVCNGVDDDLDGKIDNIDVGGDGICDCLNIATLGIPGTWGGGSAFTAWLQARGTYVVDLDDQVLDAATLAPFDIIIVNDVTNDGNPDHGIDRAYSMSEVTALQNWVQAGGGMITMIGYWDATAVVNVNLLLAPFGMSYGTTGILAASGTTPVEVWNGTHPLAFGITEVGVDNGNEPMGAGTVVASDMQTGITVGIAQSGTAEVGEGKVFVWGDEWVAYDELWNGHPEYQIEQFWVNVASWLTPTNKCEIDVIIVG